METASILALEWCAALLAGAVIAGWLGLRELRRARALEDTPVSRIRSAAQGYVDLIGRAGLMPGPAIVSPLTGMPCYWWKCKVWQTYEDDTDIIFDATSDDLFLLSDTTGECIVDPVGARVQPNLERQWRGRLRKPLRAPRNDWEAFFSSGPFRYSEQLVTGDVLLSASGWFRTQAAVQASDENRDLTALLAEWKQDRAALLRRFDTNHNGRIDPDEWEAARAAALEEVRAARAEQRLMPDLNVLGKPPDGREFRISALPRHEMRDRYRNRGRFLAALASLALFGALLVLSRQHWT